MARARQWTEEFIVPEFYKLFHGMTAAEQTGVIRGLATIRDCRAVVLEQVIEQLQLSEFPGEALEDVGTQEA